LRHVFLERRDIGASVVHRDLSITNGVPPRGIGRLRRKRRGIVVAELKERIWVVRRDLSVVAREGRRRRRVRPYGRGKRSACWGLGRSAHERQSDCSRKEIPHGDPPNNEAFS